MCVCVWCVRVGVVLLPANHVLYALLLPNHVSSVLLTSHPPCRIRSIATCIRQAPVGPLGLSVCLKTNVAETGGERGEGGRVGFVNSGKKWAKAVEECLNSGNLLSAFCATDTHDAGQLRRIMDSAKHRRSQVRTAASCVPAIH